MKITDKPIPRRILCMRCRNPCTTQDVQRTRLCARCRRTEVRYGTNAIRTVTMMQPSRGRKKD